MNNQGLNVLTVAQLKQIAAIFSLNGRVYFDPQSYFERYQFGILDR